MLNRKIVEAIANGTTAVVDGRDEDTEFECPRCGSSHFGSSSGTYYCHDEFNSGCHWRGEAHACFTTYSKQTLAEELVKLYDKDK